MYFNNYITYINNHSCNNWLIIKKFSVIISFIFIYEKSWFIFTWVRLKNFIDGTYSHKLWITQAVTI